MRALRIEERDYFFFAAALRGAALRTALRGAALRTAFLTVRLAAALRGAAFIDSIPAHSMAGRHWIIRGLIWRGHEFLDSVHNETVWDRCKELINEKDGSVPFDVLQNLLVSATSNLLGKS